jgi:hypothetical protein
MTTLWEIITIFGGLLMGFGTGLVLWQIKSVTTKVWLVSGLICASLIITKVGFEHLMEIEYITHNTRDKHGPFMTGIEGWFIAVGWTAAATIIRARILLDRAKRGDEPTGSGF